ncbi:MAG: alkaline phosphatase family protein [Conexivisphaerales archaeon]
MKVAVFALDSVPPEMLFEKLLDKLPNTKRMYQRGMHGVLRTCHPPITVPAWMVMMTGKNPGKLGIYGFRHRKPSSYTEGYIVNSSHVKERTVWEILAEKGKRSIVIGIPPSYPVKHKENVTMVSCFLTPSQERDFTNPSELKQEILKITGGRYLFDVTFRVEDRERIKRELFEMTEKRFDIAEYLIKNNPWDLFILHEIGFDRLHHAFWKFFDPRHPKHIKGNEYERIDEEYYSMVDERIGRLMGMFPDDCITFFLSDHGSAPMMGAFCVNEWLESVGYLKFKQKPTNKVEIEKAEVDWSKTKAWGWGGYYARIFFNVAGREPNGIVPQEELEYEKKRLTQLIREIKDEDGRPMDNRVFEPESLYGIAMGDKPDLMVYFDNLRWRSAGTVGHNSIYLHENDTGPDDSVHSMNGIFLMYNPQKSYTERLVQVRAEDIAPTILSLFGLEGELKSIDGAVIREVKE